MNAYDRIPVIQSSTTWLSQTMTWLYVQTRLLPPSIVSHIFCDTTDELEQFGVPNIHALDAGPALWRMLNGKSSTLDRLRKVWMFDHIVRRHAPRLIHSHFGDRGWGDIGFASRVKLKQIVTFYGYDANRLPQIEPVWRERYRDMFAAVDLVLCEGEHSASVIANLGCAERKIGVQRLGVMLDRIPLHIRRWDPKQPLRVLMAATFFEKKGIPYALEALGRIKDAVDLEVTLIGDDNGQERSRKEKQVILDVIDRCGLRDTVRMMGYRPYADLLDAAAKHHVFLSPSVMASDGDTEGGAPVTLIEMAASGAMIVSTRHCDIPAVILDGKTGLLADERDVDGLEAHLRWLIANPDRWEAMARAGRKHVEAEFDAIKQGVKLGDRYMRLLGVHSESLEPQRPSKVTSADRATGGVG